MKGFFSPIAEINFNEYINILREDFPVYGDFLRFYTLRIGDMPAHIATWLSKVGNFYNELQKIRNNMIDAYVKFALLKSGYVPVGVVEIAEEFGDNPIEVTKEYIDDLLKDEDGNSIVDDYINIENPKECIRVLLLSYPLNIWNDEALLFAQDVEVERDELIEKLTEPINKYNFESISYLIIVDPLSYRLSKVFIRELRQRIEEKMGNDIVLSTDELLNLLALDREIFESDWSDLKTKAIERLKKKYRFLTLHDEIWRIHEAKKAIKEARAKIAREDLREADCEDIIRNVGVGFEGLLGVTYHWFKQKSPSNKSLGWLFNELKNDIIDEFGEDTYNDIYFIVEKRNDVSHLKQVRISYEDALKVVKKSELFQNLFLHKVGLSEGSK